MTTFTSTMELSCATQESALYTSFEPLHHTSVPCSNYPIAESTGYIGKHTFLEQDTFHGLAKHVNVTASTLKTRKLALQVNTRHEAGYHIHLDVLHQRSNKLPSIQATSNATKDVLTSWLKESEVNVEHVLKTSSQELLSNIVPNLLNVKDSTAKDSLSAIENISCDDFDHLNTQSYLNINASTIAGSQTSQSPSKDFVDSILPSNTFSSPNKIAHVNTHDKATKQSHRKRKPDIFLSKSFIKTSNHRQSTGTSYWVQPTFQVNPHSQTISKATSSQKTNNTFLDQLQNWSSILNQICIARDSRLKHELFGDSFSATSDDSALLLDTLKKINQSKFNITAADEQATHLIDQLQEVLGVCNANKDAQSISLLETILKHLCQRLFGEHFRLDRL